MFWTVDIFCYEFDEKVTIYMNFKSNNNIK